MLLEEFQLFQTAWLLLYLFFVLLMVILSEAEKQVDLQIQKLLDNAYAQMLEELDDKYIDVERVSKGVKVTIRGKLFEQLIKGGGGALTREKIIASSSKTFVCIVDESKLVKKLGSFPVAVEVIPMARSTVARKLVQLGGTPEWRQGFVTDNGNWILDVYNLDLADSKKVEEKMD